jgi:hypothetical protein
MTERRLRRVQLRRTKGWRKPPGTVVVARPSRWGNPCTIDSAGSRAAAVAAFARLLDGPHRGDYPTDDEIRAQLGARDLACWCPLDGPCHADVLLDIANR